MKQRNLRLGKNCFYCDETTVLRETKFGHIYECPKCKAYVSVNKKTKEPLGSVADSDLRRKRRIAHYYTNLLIKRKMNRDNLTYDKAKEKLYFWLSKNIGLDFYIKSIAQLFPKETEKIINIMSKYVKR
ncbi:MAG: hypothetical protein JXR64_02900 [Spirochaetales bacterium]|nr:hypothetical protein [Spirochaetales bacterium]